MSANASYIITWGLTPAIKLYHSSNQHYLTAHPGNIITRQLTPALLMYDGLPRLYHYTTAHPGNIIIRQLTPACAWDYSWSLVASLSPSFWMSAYHAIALTTVCHLHLVLALSEEPITTSKHKSIYLPVSVLSRNTSNPCTRHVHQVRSFNTENCQHSNVAGMCWNVHDIYGHYPGKFRADSQQWENFKQQETDSKQWENFK
jgi:hypothetical protein